MNFLDKKLKDAEAEKIKIDREIDFLKTYLSENCEFLNDLKTYITDHDTHFSMSIYIKDLNDLKLIVARFKPSETIKNHLNSTRGQTENLSPFLVKCGYFQNYNTTDQTITLTYIFDEYLNMTIHIPINLLKNIKLTCKEDPFKEEKSQTEISLNEKDFFLSHSIFGTGYSFVSYNYYYASNELGVKGMEKLLELN